MKYFFAVVLFLACGITLALGARAQDATAPKVHSMTGCLAKGDAPDSYKLTNVEGGKVDSVGIVSSTVDLSKHVGHKVEITGTAVPKKDAEMDANVPKAPHYMKITAMKHIAATCP